MHHDEHEYMHAHGIEHSHDHEHADHHHDHDHEHPHHHHHDHDHEHHHHDHDHGHDHHHCHGDCSGGCAGCADPKAELVALMKYMVGHNAAHANELAQLAGKLREMGESVAYDQVMLAVSDFEKGNMRLSTVLAALNI